MELFKMAKEAMSMRSKMNEMDKKLKAQILDIEHKGIKIKVNAKNEFISVELPDSLLSEKKEKLQDLILDAFNTASKKAQDAMAESAKALTAGMNIPGLK